MRFRIATLLWIAIVVAAFFTGAKWQESRVPAFVKRTGTFPIAIVGPIHLDDDGDCDLERFVNIIELHGINVVAVESPVGQCYGVVDASTRYLVVNDAAMIDSGSEFQTIADDLAIQTISVDRLLRRIGLSHDGRDIVHALTERGFGPRLK